ncbi:MAG: GNAT family N-acetyltransferase [Oscillospiraceae bacterium]|jgi:ribosomal protein S18 acetylase RimI-like enzyme|nr:GNAT family N-acetyltransferase [Oscillospiraceae bacterium]
MFDTIRVLSHHEIERVAALAGEIWTEYYTPLIGAEQTAYMIGKFQSADAIAGDIHTKGFRYDLMTDGARDIAYCGVLPEDESLFISKIYVRGEYRKMGIARLLLGRAVNEHPKARRVWLTVNKGNETAIASYKRMGFDMEDSVVTDIGGGFVMDDYIMARRVAFGVEF